MSDDLMERFDEAEGGESNDDESERTETAGGGTKSESATTATRSRSQYPMYLSEELQEELDDRFNKFNARRELNDQEQVEKHKHFLEGLIRVALERDDIEEYVEQELQR